MTSRRDLEEMTGRWVAAGLVTPEQAGALRAAEAGEDARRSLVIEALAYLGGVLVLAASLVLVALVWHGLPEAGRLALPALATLVLLAAGRAVPGGRASTTRLRVGLWLLATAALAATLAVLGASVLELAPDSTTLLVGAGTTPLALLLWRRTRGALQHLASYAALALTVGTLAERAGWSEPTLIGVALWVLAVGWFVAGEAGVLPPAGPARVVGAVGAVVGASLTGSSGWGHAGALLTAAALFALGTRLASVPLLVVAAGATLLSVPQAVDFFFAGELAVPLALLASGAAVLVGAVLVGRRAAAAAPAGHGVTGRG